MDRSNVKKRTAEIFSGAAKRDGVGDKSLHLLLFLTKLRMYST